MNNGFISPPEIIDTAELPDQTVSNNLPLERRYSFWGNLHLSRKFFLVFGILFIFAAIIAIVTLNGLRRTQSAYEKVLAEGIEIRNLSSQLESSLLQARSNEKNFLLHWREEGFFTANINYVIPYTQNITDIRAQLILLAAFGDKVTATSTDSITQAQYEEDITSLNQNVDAYEKSFKFLVGAFQKKGFDEETDFESQFRIAARVIEEKVIGLPKLEVIFLQIRLSEKKYLADPTQAYATEVHTFIPLLKNRITESDQLTLEDKAKLLVQADMYLSAFDSLVDLDKEIAIQNENLINASSAAELLTNKFKNLGEQLASQSIETARSNNNQTYTTTIITVLVVLVLSILLVTTLSQQLTRPIISLTNIAQEISTGKFDLQATVNSRDEIGTLAQTFNMMTSQLRGALQNQDRRAQELEKQTLQLELTSQQNEKRAQKLKTIEEIGRNISVEKDLQKLLPSITKIVSNQFGFYHIGIFLLDDSGKFAVLRASNSTGGQEMLEHQHSLEVGQVGIVGNVTATGTARIAMDTGADAVFFNNPYLPQTRSELALPLKINEQVIGALDIQSVDVNGFSDEDIDVLTSLADQVTLAIQNARLFNQLERTLAESNAIQRQYIRETWSRLPQEENLGGFRYSSIGATQIGGNELIQISGNDTQKEILTPISIRGETIGTLSILIPQNEHITADQMDLIKAVANRVALSAENARLFEETSRRASRESLVSDITTKIRSTNDPQEMIKTAIAELQHALGATRVEVTPRKNAPSPDR